VNHIAQTVFFHLNYPKLGRLTAPQGNAERAGIAALSSTGWIEGGAIQNQSRHTIHLHHLADLRFKLVKE